MKKSFIVLMLLLFTSVCYSQDKNRNEILDISSGYFLGNKEISKKEFKQILSTNEKAYKEFKSGRTIQTIGIIVSSASAVFLGASIGADAIETEGYIAGGAGLLGGVLAMVGGKSMVNKSVKTYNNSIQEVTFKLGSNENGIGLVINF